LSRAAAELLLKAWADKNNAKLEKDRTKIGKDFAIIRPKKEGGS